MDELTFNVNGIEIICNKLEPVTKLAGKNIFFCLPSPYYDHILPQFLSQFNDDITSLKVKDIQEWAVKATDELLKNRDSYTIDIFTRIYTFILAPYVAVSFDIDPNLPEPVFRVNEDPSDLAFHWSFTSFDADFEPILVETEKEKPTGFRICDIDISSPYASTVFVIPVKNKGDIMDRMTEEVKTSLDKAGLHNSLSGLRYYSFRPNPLKFFILPNESKKRKMYLGIELEVCTTISNLELMYICTSVEPVQLPFFYCKEDSSISGQHQFKYEIVTFPCSPKFLKVNFRILFDKIKRLAEEKEICMDDLFDNSQRNTNGIHIHISKESFGYKKSHRLHTSKFLSFWNGWEKDFKIFLGKLSKCKSTRRMNEYCKPHPAFEGYTLVKRMKGGASWEDRYTAANDTGETVEVRVFQSLIILKHIISCIESIEAVFEFTRDASISSFKRNQHVAFLSWLEKQPKFKTLKKELL